MSSFGRPNIIVYSYQPTICRSIKRVNWFTSVLHGTLSNYVRQWTLILIYQRVELLHYFLVVSGHLHAIVVALCYQQPNLDENIFIKQQTKVEFDLFVTLVESTQRSVYFSRVFIYCNSLKLRFSNTSSHVFSKITLPNVRFFMSRSGLPSYKLTP